MMMIMMMIITRKLLRANLKRQNMIKMYLDSKQVYLIHLKKIIK